MYDCCSDAGVDAPQLREPVKNCAALPKCSAKTVPDLAGIGRDPGTSRF